MQCKVPAFTSETHCNIVRQVMIALWIEKNLSDITAHGCLMDGAPQVQRLIEIIFPLPFQRSSDSNGPDYLTLDDLNWCLDLGSLINWASRALTSLNSFSAISLMMPPLYDCLHVHKFLLFGVEFIPLFDQIKPFVH